MDENTEQSAEPSLNDQIMGMLKEDAPAAEIPVETSAEAPTDAAPAEADGRARGPDGRFLAKESEQPNAEAKPQATPEAKPQANAEAKDPQMPEGLSQGAQERFQALANDLKEAKQALFERETQHTEMTRTLEGVQSMIQESRLDQGDFRDMLNYSRAIKTGDWGSAEPYLSHHLQQFQIATGRMPSGADPLTGHPDLIQEIQAQQITPQRAMEIARGRAFQARQQQQFMLEQQRQQQVEQQSQQSQQAQQQAFAEVQRLANHWEQTDLQWPQKKDRLKAIAADIVNSGQPASTWPAMLSMAYKSMAAEVVKPKPGPQPLRASGGHDGVAAPKDFDEAVRYAINQAQTA